MKLAFEAYDRRGRRVSDVIEASDAADATRSLRGQGLFVTAVRAAGAAPAAAPPPRGGGPGAGRRLKLLAMFARQLHVLVSTGTPLVEALSAIERQTRDAQWRGVIGRLRSAVEAGGSLSEAMASAPRHFDPITRSLVAAGESSGKLSAMLDRVAVVTRKQQHVRSQIIGAMVYPALLLVVATSVLVVMLMFVLPRFAELFETLEVPLPPTTQALMALSDLLRGYWWAALAATILAAAGVWYGLHSPGGRRLWHTFVLRAPRFGRIAQSFATARLVRLLGVLVQSRLPLLEVLALVREATPNVHYRNLLGRAEAAVTRGEPISAAFNDPSLVSPSVYEAMRSGEQSGQVGSLLLNLADFLDEDNEVIVRSLTSIVEPLILLAMGALVGLVAVSLFMPLFDLTAMTAGGG